MSTTGLGITRAAFSYDAGWTVDRLLQDVQVNCLVSDPLQTGEVYAGTSGDGILRSDDRGITWHNTGLGGADVRALAASPHDRVGLHPP